MKMVDKSKFDPILSRENLFIESKKLLPVSFVFIICVNTFAGIFSKNS